MLTKILGIGYPPTMITGWLRHVARDARSILSLNRPLEFQRIVELAALKPNHRLLDVGTGDGFWTTGFAKLVADAVGLDPSAEMLQLARDLHGRANLRYDQGVAESLPYEDGAFDRIVSVSTVEHFRDPEGAIREMARTLRSGGILAVSVDTLSTTNSSEAFRTWHAARHFVTRYFTSEELVAVLRKAGLEPDASSATGIFTSRLSAALRSAFIRNPRVWMWIFPVLLLACRAADKTGLGGRVDPQIVVIRARKIVDTATR